MEIKYFRVYELRVYKRWIQEACGYDTSLREDTLDCFKTEELVKKYYPKAVECHEYMSDHLFIPNGYSKEDLREGTYLFYEETSLDIKEE